MGTKYDAITRKAQEEFGPNAVVPGSDARMSPCARIPTGIFYVDLVAGGGVPVGMVTEIYGKASAGKSSLAAKVVVSAQGLCRACYGPTITEAREVEVPTVERHPDGTITRSMKTVTKQIPVDCVNKCRPGQEAGKEKEKEKTKGKAKGEKKAGRKREGAWSGRVKTCWVDAEGSFDRAFYEQFGMDCDDVSIVKAETGEQAIDFVDAAIRTGEIDLVVIDSLAALTPKKEREISAGDIQVALQARLFNRAMRLWNASLTELQAKGFAAVCTILLINQVRAKISFMPIDTKPGGQGQDFASSLDIKLRQMNFKFDTSGRPLWQTSSFQVEKNRVGEPKRQGEFRLCVTPHPGRNPGDTWDDEVVADAAQAQGFVTTNDDGSLTVLERAFPDEQAFRAEMHQRAGLYRELRVRVLDRMSRPSDGQVSESKKTRGSVGESEGGSDA